MTTPSVENQPTRLRAITVRVDVNDLKGRRGPQLAHYNYLLDRGRTYRFVPNSALVADDVSTIIAEGGGNPGNWILVREQVDGAPLGDGDVDITVGGDFFRTLPVGTLTQDSIATLKTTNAERGDIITITRLDVEAFTYTLNNDGPGGGTLVVFPSGGKAFADVYFDGTDWVEKRSAAML